MSVFRTSDILLVLVMIAAAALTYKVKYDSQKNYAHIRQLERQIEAEKDSFALLKADWAQASDPARLNRLVAHYHEQLGLDIMTPRQIVALSDVPEKLPDAIDLLIADNDDLMIAEGSFETLDTVITGSVTP